MAIFHIFLDGGAPLRYHTHPRPPGDVAPWVTWRPLWPRGRRHRPQRRGGMLGEPRGFETFQQDGHLYYKIGRYDITHVT